MASTVLAYREAIDFAWGRMLEGASDDEACLPAARLQELSSSLAQVFARAQDEQHDGLSPGFLDGVRHQRLVRGRSPGHRGVLVGRVEQVKPRENLVVVWCEQSEGVRAGEMKRGDGVVFDSVKPRRAIGEEGEEGGAVYDVRPVGRGRVELRFGAHASPDLRRVSEGALVWRNSDPSLERSLRGVANRPVGAAISVGGDRKSVV